MVKKRFLLAAALGGLTAFTLFLIQANYRARSQDNGMSFSGNERADALIISLLIQDSANFRIFKDSAISGAEAAVHAINENGGILGRKLLLKLIPQRDETEEDLAQSLSALHPIFVFQVGDEMHTRRAARAAVSSKTPLVYLLNGPCKTQINPSEERASQYLWGAGLSPQAVAEPLFVHLNEHISHTERELNVYFVGGDTTDDRMLITFAREAAEELAFKTVAEKYYDNRILDYYTPIREILEKKPDILFFSNPSSTGLRFLEQIEKMGVGKEMVITGTTTFEQEFIEQIEPTPEDFLSIGRYAASLKTEANSKFLDAWRKVERARGKTPTATSATTYGMFFLIKEALQKANSTDTENYLRALGEAEFSFPQGHAYMDAKNHVLNQPMFILKSQAKSWVVAESLGEATHPKIEGCIILEEQKHDDRNEDD